MRAILTSRQQPHPRRRTPSGLFPSLHFYLSVVCVSSALLLLPLAATAVDAPETLDLEASCATGECHDEITSLPHLHWTDFTNAGECNACHEPDGDAHEFETDGSNEVCLECHEALSNKMEGAKIVHEAAEDGCVDCHNPHGGKTSALLEGIKSDNLKSLCFDCHEPEILEEKVKHGPAADGACNQCHDPHASQYSTLLLEKVNDLCGSCHEEIAEGINNSKYIHDPVDDGCIECHDPHSGPQPLMLSAQKRGVCNECHDDIVEAAENASTDHYPVLTGDECLNCHNPHASNAAANLRMPQRDLCLSCHDKPVESGTSMLQDMKSLLEENPEWHKPVVEDDCSACHDPHGTNHFRILKEPYSKKFYNKFDIDNYALCFSCHEETLVLSEDTLTLTGFRDGNQNLHFLHVNRKKKGRSCRSCHEVHASKFPLHIRESVAFGKWDMPLNFEKTEQGGSCAPGCHQDEDYDRSRKNVLKSEPTP